MKLFGFDIHIGDWRVLIQSRDIQNGAVQSRHIADDAVSTEKIADKAITTEKIADKAITTEKIADKAITTEKIANKAVTREKIADGAIDNIYNLFEDLVENYKPIVINGDVTNAPDEEDITSEDGLLKLKNRSPFFSNRGFVILRRDAPLSEQITLANTIYEVKYNFDLDGETIAVPEGCVLHFDGGNISNGSITLNNTVIDGTGQGFTNVTISGTPYNSVMESKWFSEHSKYFVLPNTKYIINSPVSLGGAVVKFKQAEGDDPELTNCKITTVDGCTLSNGVILAYTHTVIEGYGITASIGGWDFIERSPMYCSATKGLKYGGDGSPEKPFYYIQDAILRGNIVLLERGSVFGIHQIMRNNYDYFNRTGAMAYSDHNIQISTYGKGRRPIISGLCAINPVGQTEVVDGEYRKTELDFSDGYATLYNLYDFVDAHEDYVKLSDVPEVANFGLCLPIVYLRGFYDEKLLFAHLKDENTAKVYLEDNPTAVVSYNPGTRGSVSNLKSDEFLHLTYIAKGATGYGGGAYSACVLGINCARGVNLSIEDVDFEFLATAIVTRDGMLDVENCRFRYIGGNVADNSDSSWVKQGNAITAFMGDDLETSKANMWTVNNCTFYDIYDTAISIQGKNVKSSTFVTNNKITRVRMGVEFFGSPIDHVNPTYNMTGCISNNVFTDCNLDSLLWKACARVYKENGHIVEAEYGACRIGQTRLTRLSFANNIIYNSPMLVAPFFDNNTILLGNKIHCKGGDNVVYAINTDHSLYMVDANNVKDIENAINAFTVYNKDNQIYLDSGNQYYGTIGFEGDSICRAGGDSKGGYAGRASKALGLTCVNNGANGATTMLNPSGASILTNVLSRTPGSYKYFVIQPSIANDSVDETNIGTLSTEFIQEGAVSDYDGNTYYGALELMARYAQKYFKKVGFIVPYKMGATNDYTLNKLKADAIVDVCNKYGIPCLNLQDVAGFNLISDEVDAIYGSDHYHCNSDGYAVLTNKVVEFIKSL